MFLVICRCGYSATGRSQMFMRVLSKNKLSSNMRNMRSLILMHFLHHTVLSAAGIPCTLQNINYLDRRSNLIWLDTDKYALFAGTGELKRDLCKCQCFKQLQDENLPLKFPHTQLHCLIAPRLFIIIFTSLPLHSRLSSKVLPCLSYAWMHSPRSKLKADLFTAVCIWVMHIHIGFLKVLLRQ